MKKLLLPLLLLVCGTLFGQMPFQQWELGPKPYPMRIGGKWGYFHPYDSVVIPPQFEEARPFKQEFACVRTGTGWGIIDKEGNWVRPAQYEEAKILIECGRWAILKEEDLGQDPMGLERLPGKTEWKVGHDQI